MELIQNLSLNQWVSLAAFVLCLLVIYRLYIAMKLYGHKMIYWENIFVRFVVFGFIFLGILIFYVFLTNNRPNPAIVKYALHTGILIMSAVAFVWLRTLKRYNT